MPAVLNDTETLLLDMTELVEAVEHEMAMSGGKLGDKDTLRALMEQFDGKSEHFERYEHLDPNAAYTRNLVATDNRSYALIVLCWRPGMGSPIHNHPGDGCWMSMLKGQLKETQYHAKDGHGSLKPISEHTYARPARGASGGVQCAYIDDSIALHKVENASYENVAVSLHLYSPLPSFCKCWDDPQFALKTRQGRSGVFYSKYGVKCSNSVASRNGREGQGEGETGTCLPCNTDTLTSDTGDTAEAKSGLLIG
jgi:cysteine dioxygenase